MDNDAENTPGEGAFKRLMLVRAGGRVSRYHQNPMHHRQEVAAHQGGMLQIILTLAPPALVDRPLMLALTHHDVPEVATGDTPAQAKWRWPRLKDALDEAEDQFEKAYGLTAPLFKREAAIWLKGADLLEGLLTCYDQMFLGNRHMELIFWRYYQAITAWAECPVPVVDVAGRTMGAVADLVPDLGAWHRRMRQLDETQPW